VPEIEEREAALFCGYTWKEWQQFELTDPAGRWERASGIAHYRMHSMIERHVDESISREMDRRSKAAH
jgi:hypothetical protein